MENIYVGKPGLREFKAIFWEEKNGKVDKQHLRLCIRNYKDIKYLNTMISRRRLFFISRIYKSHFEYEAFKFIYFLENRNKMKRNYLFKIKSKQLILNHRRINDKFYNDISSRLANNLSYKNLLYNFRTEQLSNISLALTTVSTSNLLNVRCSESHKSISNPPIKRFFLDTSFDSSDQNNDCVSEAKMSKLLFTNDLFLREIGDHSQYLNKSSISVMGEESKDRCTIKLKVNKSEKQQTCTAVREGENEKIVFCNSNLNEIESKEFVNHIKGVQLTEKILEGDQPKSINLDNLINNENELVDFNFKKVDKEKSVLKESRVLKSKDVNLQNPVNTENYEQVLRKNTHINSNYKYIKVLRTNVMPKKTLLGVKKRQKLVSFSDSNIVEPHNKNEIVPILVSSKGKQRIKISKGKQTVFIKKLI